LRNDRQPEFTQIDLEASFVGVEDVIGYVEQVLVALWDEAGHTVARPFPRLTWRDAMERYGTDKPDLRFGLVIGDWTAQVKALGALGVADGDAALMTVGPDRVTSPVLDRVRQEVIRRLAPAPHAAHAFCWVVDFPLFEPDPETGRPVFAHHPFTAPHPDDVAPLDTDPFACRALHYDAVYDGNELGSGSIRITDPAVQRRVFAHLGMTPGEAEARFGFLLNGLQAGAPPHGGFAIGFDRVVVALAGAESMRDVIAFPKTTAARALFEGAPSPANPADLATLHIEVKR